MGPIRPRFGWNTVDMERVASKLLRPSRIFVAPPSAVVESRYFTVCNGDLRDPLRIGCGDDKVGRPSLSVVGLCSDKSVPGTYGAG